MHSMKLISALAAFGAGLVSAQTSLCSQPTLTITAAADATNIPCTTVEGSVLINPDIVGDVRINGPRTIKGDLIVNNATKLTSLSSLTVAAIGGRFQMQGLTVLSTLQFNSLAAVDTISWITLPALSTLTFGTAGVTTVKSITISDTFLNSLDGLNVVSVDTFNINNNKRLTSYASDLANVTKEFNIGANGFNLKLSLPRLVWVQEFVVSDIESIDIPQLQTVNGSMRFNKNKFTSFIAPNLTSTDTGDVSFINNDQMNNCSFPVLTETGGSITIQNNTLLEKMNAFPNLVTIGGAVELRGNFTEVTLPKLNDVKGAFNVQSTADIKTSCAVFDKMAGREIQGKYDCDGLNANANSGNSTGGSGGSGNNKDGAAGVISVNMPAIIAMAAIGALAQIML